jgi:hypothetical protein
MTKTQIKVMLGPQLTALTAATTGVANNKWIRSKNILDIYQMINWTKTPYNSFKNFVDTELPDIKWDIANLWKTHYRRALKFKYTPQELTAISACVTYSLAVAVMTTMVRKLTVSSFIKRARTVRTSSMKYIKPGTHNSINIVLPDAHMDKLERILSGFGFSKSANGLRQGVSAAFINYLDSI